MPEIMRELVDHIHELAEAREVTWFDTEEKPALHRCLLGVRTNLTGSVQFSDVRARNFPQRFYRVSIP